LIAQQQWSNDSVGTWGPSALGLIQFQTAKENPPHLTCCVPIVAGMRSDYQKYFPGGVYRTEYVQMLDALGYGLSTILLAHPVHDLYWTIAENSSFYPASINVPMFMIGGWYDHATEEVLESFEGIRTQSAVTVRAQQKLLMGPWTHNTTANGALNVGALAYPEAQGASDSLARKFFDYYLLNNSNGWNSRPVVEYFQMGENTWKNDASWNTSNLTSYNLFFHPDGSMALNFPLGVNDSLAYTYDPHNPSPTVGGPTLLNTLDQGPYDQAPVVESRNDLLSFTTAPLSTDVVMRGKPVVHLNVTSDRFDTDVSVRLTDVYPDGRSMLLLDGIKRMRFRAGFEAADTAVLIPGHIYGFNFDLFANTAITFLAGHKIRVDVTSSNYPRFDCNLNNGQTMYVAGDTLTAMNSVHVNPSFSSYIILQLESFPDAVNEMSEEIGFEVYPNPSQDWINVHLSHFTLGPVTFKIIDLTGREIQIINSNFANCKLPIADYPNGLYFIRAEAGDKIFTTKICIAR